LIGFEGREYTGLDIVQAMVEENQRLFGAPGIRFAQCDFVSHVTPPADVVLVKDVLQHLSNESISLFVQQNLRRYRYAIFTNDVRRYREERRFGIFPVRHDLQQPNSRVEDGGSRPVKLTEAPFSLRAAERVVYPTFPSADKTVIYIKEILVWARDDATLVDT
jgi:hypothetical protein